MLLAAWRDATMMTRATRGQYKGDSAGVPLNPFEAEICDALQERLGIKIVPQFGVGSYRIDLAVQHPVHPGRFVMAIECDGAAYHSSPTARMRDRQRQRSSRIAVGGFAASGRPTGSTIARARSRVSRLHIRMHSRAMTATQAPRSRRACRRRSLPLRYPRRTRRTDHCATMAGNSALYRGQQPELVRRAPSRRISQPRSPNGIRTRPSGSRQVPGSTGESRDGAAFRTVRSLPAPPNPAEMFTP